ncbi:MAG: hypothetical protein WDN69_10695 [Aliidongia sp.]
MPLTSQLMLPLEPTPRLRHGRIVEPHAEAEGLYDAVLILRRHGRTVYRAGAEHKVDGRLLSTRQLLALARNAPATPTRADI